ncbi:hypothetical protein TI39_contig4348g00003 [Zymoseptoria brevis]|uniref:Uncharacterized protein n=1 Tax=Zymoseptoria brevis TaxID=1047168 RepID=A0A0F4G7B4_9PEZI|nr:hypothetical protein TI39_contig4348g00003 [Zymoseptoria brevis]
MQAEAAVAGFHNIYTGNRVTKGGQNVAEMRCTQYLGCTYVSLSLFHHRHEICKFCKVVFPLNTGSAIRKYFAAHECACGGKLNNMPIVKPPRRLFATVDNMIVWFDPKNKSGDAFVKLTAYADLDLDFTIFYPEDDALAPRIQEVDDAPAVADADAEKENRPPPQKKTKLFPMFGGK